MKWTTERPTKGGYYWMYNERAGRGPILAHAMPPAGFAKSFTHFYGPLVAPDPPPKPIVVEACFTEVKHDHLGGSVDLLFVAAGEETAKIMPNWRLPLGKVRLTIEKL